MYNTDSDKVHGNTHLGTVAKGVIETKWGSQDRQRRAPALQQGITLIRLPPSRAQVHRLHDVREIQATWNAFAALPALGFRGLGLWGLGV